MGELGLKTVQSLCRRRQYERLDTTPFLLIYAMAFGELITKWKETKQDDVNWISCQLVAIGSLHILICLFCHWSVDVKSKIAYFKTQRIDRADAVMVQYADYAAAKQILPLHRRKFQRAGKEHEEVLFEARFKRFVYDDEEECFKRLEYPINKPIEWYLHCEGYKSINEVSEALKKWGPNAFDVPVPKFTSFLQQQLLAPFFVFQTFCVGLWCMDEYWMYSLFTLLLLVFFECTVAGQRLRNLQHLRSLQNPSQPSNVYRNGKWEKVPGQLIVPGDIVSIGGGPSGNDEIMIPADCVLLNGTCIVDESVLTGESTPQWKAPLSSALEDNTASDLILDLKRDKLHVLYSGTKCLQHTSNKAYPIKTADGGCLAVVIQTGFETAQGNLMGTILHSTEQVSANNWETGIFILFLLCFAIAASAYVLYHGLQDPSRSRFKLFLNCTMIVTSVIPPELPMELSIAVNHSLIQLMRKKIFCTEPFRIPFAGKVDVCCFDKTGTLTDDSMILDGVATTTLGTEITPATELPLHISRILASCHSLTMVNRQLVGDPLEKAAFEAVKWNYRSNEVEHPKREESIMILHRYHFSAQLKRMSTIIKCKSAHSASHKILSVAKGAPETMYTRFKDPPENYHALYKKFASLGGRVIALGSRDLNDTNAEEAAAQRGFNREISETGLTFSGFAIFQCPLKTDSTQALNILKNSSHGLVMITGDAALTACNAASLVHITTRSTLILTNKTSLESRSSDLTLTDEDFEWLNPDESQKFPFLSTKESILDLTREWDLCITGDCFGHIEKQGLASFLIPLIQVFARVAPEHKAKVVETLQKSGRIVLMCGDGTNDVGALKAAHVGVALLTACNSKPSTSSSKLSKKDLQKAKSGHKNIVSLKTKNHGVGSKKDLVAEYIEELEKQGRPVNPSVRKIAKLVEEMNEDPSLVKPGDSSMAAPFTSKKSSVMPCTDLIMQGRSTLVSTVQMFKILGLMSLANAYAMSVMHLQNVKIGDVQATMSGLLSAGMFFFLSNTEPLATLSKRRPHPTIFCPYVFLSVLGQSIIHMSYLIYMYQCSIAYMPVQEDKEEEEKEEEESDSGFQPNIINSVCFLVNFVIQIITFAVNYSGAPFTTPLLSNTGLLRCLLASGGFSALLLVDMIPGLTNGMEMVFIPYSLRGKIFVLALTDLALTHGLETFLKFAFPAPLPIAKRSNTMSRNAVKKSI